MNCPNLTMMMIPAIDLWHRGFVPSFDGTTWRLHSGKNADIVYSIADKEVKDND